MYRNILVPVDAEGLSDRALEHAASLAGALGARVTLMTVAEPAFAHAAHAGEMHEALKTDATTSRAKTLLDSAGGRLRSANIAYDVCVYCGEKPWEGISMAADDHKCDLIVMASRGGSHIDGFVFGSVAASVLTRSHVPVLVVKEPEAEA
ncbi:MAG TPA: universal stress protein [Rhodoblastus sp.]|nr:universal stress protein [Rhodoblastus sp.]